MFVRCGIASSLAGFVTMKLFTVSIACRDSSSYSACFTNRSECHTSDRDTVDDGFGDLRRCCRRDTTGHSSSFSGCDAEKEPKRIYKLPIKCLNLV